MSLTCYLNIHVLLLHCIFVHVIEITKILLTYYMIKNSVIKLAHLLSDTHIITESCWHPAKYVQH